MQFFIYKEIRERFSDHLWLNVASKCDLLQESPVIFNTEDVGADDPELVGYRKMGPEGAIHVSVKNEASLNQVIVVLSCIVVSATSKFQHVFFFTSFERNPIAPVPRKKFSTIRQCLNTIYCCVSKTHIMTELFPNIGVKMLRS